MALSKEAKVGIFSVLAIIFFLIALVLTNNIQVILRGYTLNIIYKFVGDLKPGSPVKLAGGLKIGYVKKLERLGNQMSVQLWIDDRYPVDTRARFIIGSTSLMGDRYLNVEVENPSGLYLTNNSVITGISPISLDNLSIKVGNAVNSLFGESMNAEDIQRSFRSLFNNTSDLMYQLNKTVQTSEPEVQRAIKTTADALLVFNVQMKEILTALDHSAKNLDTLTSVNSERLSQSIANLQLTAQSLQKAAKDLEIVSANSRHITDAIRNQEGVVGKLVYDKKLAKRLDAILENTEVLTEKVKRNPKSLIW
jgi:phospholipid/cholesterol/gamma-HCH transport system substrate-binding protein